MAGKAKDIDLDELIALACKYADECIEATKEIATMKGPVKIKERHLPTISYFLYHFLRREHFEFYKRSNWYDALSNKEHRCSDTIKSIDEMFNALAADIVANEGKGIFYAKNKLGMSDKVETKNENAHLLTGKVSVNVISSGIPLANRETDVDA